ncbi:MAG: hypothetical protein GTO03_07770 [Planctomycetales bacterium]|nr:hypothetical protein [Planctomycetales bacterium]
MIQIVDPQGTLVKTDARELLAVTELDTVVVSGKAQRDEAGNLTILARKLYLKSPAAAAPPDKEQPPR